MPFVSVVNSRVHVIRFVSMRRFKHSYNKIRCRKSISFLMVFVVSVMNYFAIVYCVEHYHHTDDPMNQWSSRCTFWLYISVWPSPICAGKQPGYCFWRFVPALQPLRDLAEFQFWKRRVESAIKPGRIVGSVHSGIVLGRIVTNAIDLEPSCSRMVLNFFHRSLGCRG